MFSIIYYCKQIVIDKEYNILLICPMLIVKNILLEVIGLICSSVQHIHIQIQV